MKMQTEFLNFSKKIRYFLFIQIWWSSMIYTKTDETFFRFFPSDFLIQNKNLFYITFGKRKIALQ